MRKDEFCGPWVHGTLQSCMYVDFLRRRTALAMHLSRYFEPDDDDDDGRTTDGYDSLVPLTFGCKWIGGQAGNGPRSPIPAGKFLH